ncbi:hypothetical protein [Streptomyces sp. NPDC000618]|uniref:hypothetical protein n=1 Tax=Streptomyces sp. NPDC000618 TaxID=3154265 RepID=UPI003328431D
MTATAQRKTATVKPVIRSMQSHYAAELERFVGSALNGAGAKRPYLDPPIVYPLPVLHPGMKLPLIEEQGRVQGEFKDATAKSVKDLGDYLQSMQKDVQGAAEEYAKTKNKGSLHDRIEEWIDEAGRKVAGFFEGVGDDIDGFVRSL